jgi:hypothetical protein
MLWALAASARNNAKLTITPTAKTEVHVRNDTIALIALLLCIVL